MSKQRLTDPKTGKELWRMRHRGWSVAPRPIYGHGLIFATIDRDAPELWAIRPDGNGDITACLPPIRRRPAIIDHQ